MSITALAKIQAERDSLVAQLAASDQKAAKARRDRAGEIAALFEKSDLILKTNSEVMALIHFGETQPKSWWEEIAKTGSGSFRRNAGKRSARAAAAEPPAASNTQPTTGAVNGDAGQAGPSDLSADAPRSAAGTH